MHPTLRLLITCLLVAACKESGRPAEKSAILPSGELEDKVRVMDDVGFRTATALEHEVAMAKGEWER